MPTQVPTQMPTHIPRKQPTTLPPTPKPIRNQGSTTGSRNDWKWACSFDSPNGGSDFCDITQDRNDDFDWTLTNKRTPSYETGPDHAYNGEYYIFIEASNPRTEGDKAV